MLRYLLRTLKTWDINVQEAIFMDMIIRVPNKLSRVKLVSNFFDDASPLGKTILEKITSLIDHLSEGRGFSSFSGTYNWT